MRNTQEFIDRVCDYRGLPKIKEGTRCEVDGKQGVICGGNTSANFNVRFDDGRVSNCHPNWRMRILDSDGSVIHESDDA